MSLGGSGDLLVMLRGLWMMPWGDFDRVKLVDTLILINVNNLSRGWDLAGWLQ